MTEKSLGSKRTLVLLFPWLRSMYNSWYRGRSIDRLKGIFFAALGLGFWIALFIGAYLFFGRLAQEEPFGPILVDKLIRFVFVIFFAVLIFSNIVSSLNAFFLSDDLYLMFSAPVSFDRLYVSRYFQTMFLSSWMVLLFALPVFMAYGVVFDAPGFYYPWMILIMLTFLLLPCALASVFTMILVKAFPARKTQDVLIILAILFVVSLYFLLRFLQPEQLFNPDIFHGFTEFFATMRTPDALWMPTTWVTIALNAGMSINGIATDGAFYFMLTLINGLFSILVGSWIAQWLYLDAYSKSQEGRNARISAWPFVSKLIDMLIRTRNPKRRQVMLKDIRTFFRETTQWTQLLLLLALIVVYLFNYKVLHLERYAGITFYLRNLISYLNMILAGFVLSAICVRFALPSVSVEGKAFWIIQTSPLRMKSFLWSKFWFNLFPIFIVAEALIIVSNIFLKTSNFLMVVSAVIMGFVALGLVALAVGVGAMFPNFEEKNVARMASGASSIIYMVIAIAFVLFVVGVLALPVRIWQMHLLAGTGPTPMDWAITILAAILITIAIVSALVFPMRMGIRALENREN